MCFIAVELLQANWNFWPTLTKAGKMEEFKIKIGGSSCSMHGNVFFCFVYFFGVPSVLITSTWFLNIIIIIIVFVVVVGGVVVVSVSDVKTTQSGFCLSDD